MGIVRQLTQVAEQHGALALVTEGGYELTALAACLEATTAAVDGAGTATVTDTGADGRGEPGAPVPSSARGQRALLAVRDAQAAHWRGL